MIHSGPVTLEVKDGFVTIETAEHIRRQGVKEAFCVKGADAFARAVERASQLKESLQAWEQSKAEIATLADGVHVSDVLDCVESESSERVKVKATLSQAEQIIKKATKRAA